MAVEVGKLVVDKLAADELININKRKVVQT